MAQAMAVRYYSINQKKVDEACWTMFEDIILEVASEKMLREMVNKIERILKKGK